jgi:hypothetical protein
VERKSFFGNGESFWAVTWSGLILLVVALMLSLGQWGAFHSLSPGEGLEVRAATSSPLPAGEGLLTRVGF